MNSISGIGGQYPLSINGLRSKDGFREEELVALAPPIAPPPTFKADAGYDHQSEQAYEEAFAKLRVNLQNRAELQAAEERQEKAAGVSVGAADPQEQAALLS